MITIDASVLVAAIDRTDPAQATAARFLATAVASGSAIHQPTLMLVEVTAAIARRAGDTEAALDAGTALLSMPGLVLHDLDLEGAADAAAIGARARVRGADAVYVAVAERHQTTLVTLDDELRTRAGHLVSVVTPQSWLEAQPPG